MNEAIDTVDAAWLARLPAPVAGIDEAGRGALAGPVVAAAVVLPNGWAHTPAMADSKTLTARRREALWQRIAADCEVGIGIASVDEIDALNILRATLLAMQRAEAALARPPGCALVDGSHLPRLRSPCAYAIVGGDRHVATIAAASIAAKVTRDRLMRELDARYPGYGFAAHAGYGTAAHLRTLHERGPCPAHRTSFAPVRHLRSL